MAKTRQHRTNLLSQRKVETATCPKGKKQYPYSDGNGLYLTVYADGRKNWLVRLYRNKAGVQRGAGKYPAVSLAAARRTRDSYQQLWDRGIDPSLQKQKAKLGVAIQSNLTFSSAYALTLARQKAINSPRHVMRWEQIYKLHVEKALGKFPLVDIDDEMILRVIQKVYTKTPHSAIKVKSLINMVFIHMKEEKMFRGSNPVNELKGNTLIKHPKSANFAHLDESRVGEFIKKLEAYPNLFINTFLYVIMITALRTNSLRNAKWKWLDIKTNTLVIPAEFMKGRESFRCPIPKKAMTKLKALKQLGKGQGKGDEYIFQGLPHRPISDAGARICLQKTMGEKITVHGFRTLYNRVVTKMNKYQIEMIESQLSHSFVEVNAVRKSYLGTEDYLDIRREIVQTYEDWCSKQ